MSEPTKGTPHPTHIAAEAFIKGDNPMEAVAESMKPAKEAPKPAVEVTPLDPGSPIQTMAPPDKKKDEEDPEAKNAALNSEEERLHIEKAILESKIEFEKQEGTRYEKILENAGLSRQAALAIIDAVFLQGHRYTERFQIYSRLSVTFRTRLVEDGDRINIAIEKAKAHHGLALAFEHWRTSLACSIVRYGNLEFDDDFDKRVEWVSSLSEPVYSVLTGKLQEFDRKVEVIFSDGFLSNF